jgi:phage baseplate assembly protein gpV
MSLPSYTGQDLYGIIQAIVKEELSGLHITQLGEVTEVFSHESDGDKNNYQVSVMLRDSGISLPRVSVATQRIGLVALPQIGDLVIVQFIGGDIHHPVITGRVYNDVDRPPVAKPDEWVFETRDSQESDTRRFAAVFPNNNSITIMDDEATIIMGDSTITLKNDGTLELTGKGDINLKADGNILIEAGGDLKMEAKKNAQLKAGADLTAEGSMNGTLKAGTSVTVEGGVDGTLKGAMVTIAGMTSFSAG